MLLEPVTLSLGLLGMSPDSTSRRTQNYSAYGFRSSVRVV